MKNKTKRKSIHHHLHKEIYPARALLIVLMGLMFIEGMLFGVATGDDVNVGLQVLNLNTSIQQTYSDLTWLAEPLIQTAKAMNEFYNLASLETISLFENNIVDNVATMSSDLNKFYRVASRELASALDFSSAQSVSFY